MPYYRPYLPQTPELQLLTAQLREQQQQLRKDVMLSPLSQPVQNIAGCDSSFIGENILSVFVVLSFPELEEIEVQYHVSPVELPYIPGFLAFREVPNLVKTYQQLKHKPDVIMVDGHGMMHPRRMGIATHLGVVLNRPTFGVAKKKLVGKYEEPATTKDAASYVTHNQEVVGVALRSKDKVKTIFVSAGHLCTLDDAFSLTVQTLRSHKLPEPTRIADKYSKSLKKEVTFPNANVVSHQFDNK
jgi:deoxyribonuclease V